MSEKKTNINDLNVLLGVTAGIAAYKAVDLASKLTAGGAKVNTVMTASACKLIGPKSFEAVTCSMVFTSLWSADSEYNISHINLVDWADIVVVTPATANIIGKIANGICDEILSTTLCSCWQKPSLLAPAMNEMMWENPAVQRNLEVVREMGFEIVGPEKGRLACGTEGVGRMSEAIDILGRIEKIASQIKK